MFESCLKSELQIFPVLPLNIYWIMHLMQPNVIFKYVSFMLVCTAEHTVSFTVQCKKKKNCKIVFFFCIIVILTAAVKTC